MKKVFISYSWDNEQHKIWVKHFADDLKRNGVEVMLDQYDLQLGAHLLNYIDTAINSADFVLIIMTPNYKKKSMQLKGGVGYEYSICNRELFENQKNNRKFIPILRKGNENESVPIFLKSFVRISMIDDNAYQDNFKTIIGTITGNLARIKNGSLPIKIKDYSFEILNTFIDGNKPIILSFGKKNVGKTSVLLCIFWYLSYQYKFKISSNLSYRQDKRYMKTVSYFQDLIINHGSKPKNTNELDFLLIDLLEHFELIGRFFDFEGAELLTNKQDIQPYLKQILHNMSIPKLFMLFFDKTILSDDNNFRKYIDYLIYQILNTYNHKKDKVIIIFSKVDEFLNVDSSNIQAEAIYSENEKQVKYLLNNKSYFSKLTEALSYHGISNVNILPHSSYSQNYRDNTDFSKDIYTKKLWNVIYKQFLTKSFGIFKWK